MMLLRCRLNRRFQSTLPRGERLHYMGVYESEDLFQSTLPRGERRRKYLHIWQAYIFQSTLPRGERLLIAAGGAIL